MRSLAIALPRLGLDVWRSEADLGDRPAALSERRGARDWVAQACPAATARGAGAGTPLAEAAARVPDLAFRERDPEHEALALEALAAWAYERLSPRVAGLLDLASDGASALIVDLTGTERLLPDEGAVLTLAGAGAAGLGLTARLALADPRPPPWRWRASPPRRPFAWPAGSTPPGSAPPWATSRRLAWTWSAGPPAASATWGSPDWSTSGTYRAARSPPAWATCCSRASTRCWASARSTSPGDSPASRSRSCSATTPPRWSGWPTSSKPPSCWPPSWRSSSTPATWAPAP